MSNADKILSVIREESEQRIKEMNDQADKIYQEITGEAQKKAQEIRRQGEHKVHLQAENLLKTFHSKSELEKRNAILKTKRAEIEKTIDLLHKHMLSLETKEYFRVILKLAESLDDTEGTMYFNSADLKRMPSNFGNVLTDHSIKSKVSSEPDNSIDGGFILKNGDVEENMSFSAVIAANREKLEDVIGSELFVG